MNKMRKVIGILMSLTMALCFAFAIGCAEDEPVKSISLSESAVTMSLFDETTLTVTKTNISEEVEWTTTDNTVLNITKTENGVQLIAIKADASTTITATAGGKSASCTVTVESTTDTLMLSRSVAGKVILFEEETVDPVAALGMSVAFGGEAFTKANMEYVLTDVEPAGCITIEEGILTAVAEGKATLTAKAAYYGNYSNEITVEVEVYPEITVDFLDIAGNDVTLYTAGTNTEVEVKADLICGTSTISYPTLKSAVSANDQVAVWDNEAGKVKAIGVGETTITFTYEFKTTREVVGVLNVTVMENPLYFGQHEKFAVDGVVAKMTEGKALVYENASLTNDENSPLIRLQIVQSVDNVHEGTYAHPNGARDFYITIQDAENPLNYITVLVTSYKYAADGDWAFGAFNIGARASVWGSHVIGDTSDAFYGQRVGKNANPVGVGLNTTSGGWDGGASGFSFFENFLTTPKDGNDSLTENMIAISVKGQTVYFHINGEVFSLLDMSQSIAGQKVWPGFGDSTKANIYVAVGGFNNADYAHLVIDTIGNAATTSADVDKFKVVNNGTSLVPEFTHIHDWNTEYSTNETEHWIICKTLACFDIKEGSLGAHDWEDGKCSVCEYECVHNFENSTCSKCQLACSHDWEDGECSICEAVCTHTWVEGECSICEKVCGHSWKDGACSICQFVCDHDYGNEGGTVCVICGEGCDHDWEDGHCDRCGTTCKHTWEDGECSVCDVVCSHTWANGKCSVCGTICTHTWEDGVCGICSTACEHSEIVEGACTTCGCTVDVNISYGQHEKFAVNGVIAKMTEGDTLAYEGVSLTNDENSPLIRLQIVQSVDNVHAGTYAHPNGARDIYITIQDAENPLNYITVLVTSYKYAGDGDWAFGAFNIGVRASVWGSHVIGDTSDAFYGQRVGKSVNPVGLNTTSGGWDGGASGFSFFENFLTTPKAGNDSLTDNMIAISVKGQTVYFHINGEVFSLLDMSQSIAGQKVWPGFSNGAKANIYVAVGGFNNADHAHLVIDTIGNAATTAKDVVDFKLLDNGTSLVPEFTHTHDWSDEYTQGVSEHWIECATVGCLEIKDKGVHDLSTGACICGLAHTHSWNYAFDRVNHYEECGCTDIQNVEAHTVENGACSCGYSALRYGQDALWAHDGVLADVRNGESITMNGVALPTYTDGLGAEEALVRFQYIPEKTGGLRPVGPQVIYITITDAEDSANSIKLMIVQYTTDAPTTHACVGAKAQDSSDYKGALGTLTLVGTDAIEGYGSDTNSFSFVGTHLNESNYEKYMMGIVVNGTTVSMQSAGENLVILDLATDGWAGFTSSNVNVTISFARYLNNSTVGTLSFDVLGGVALNANSVSNFTIA